MKPLPLVLAARVRSRLTDATHHDPARFDLLRGSKSEIEHVMATAIAPAAWADPDRALEHVVRFAIGNRFSSSGRFIRDMLQGIYGAGSGLVQIRPLTRLDDDLSVPLLTVLTALLAPSCTPKRLSDQDIVGAFRRLGGEEFFFEAPSPTVGSSHEAQRDTG